MPNLTKTQKRMKVKRQIATLKDKLSDLKITVNIDTVKAGTVPQYRYNELTNLLTKIEKLQNKLVGLEP